MTLRMTSPACMARKASFTSSRPISALTMSAMSSRPGLHQADEPGEVPADLGRPVDAAEEASSPRRTGRTRSSVTCESIRGVPDDHDGPAPPGRRRQAWLIVSGQTDHLERVVGAPPSRSARAPARPGRRRPGSTRSVAPSCSAALRFSSTGSTAMIRPAPAIRSTLDHRLPDPTATDDRDAAARLDLRGVERGADAGGHPAPDERELLVGHVGRRPAPRTLRAPSSDQRTCPSAAKRVRTATRRHRVTFGRKLISLPSSQRFD